ncbi:MAG: hypothetical protein Ct9H90mP30_7310 [Actinomycetota bacterium]|nr:MAG: hypothetical protein Ct9H90mP30_7310 [Actinomycetota bacterium]
MEGFFYYIRVIKVNLEINVNEDGSGTYGGEFAISKVFAENFTEGDQSSSCDEILNSDDNELGPLSDLPPDAEIEFFEDDSWCGYNFTASFSDFGAVAEEDDGFPITEDEGIATFRLPADDLFGDVTGENRSKSEDIDSAMLLKALGIPEPEFVVAVTIAGEILEQNADEVRGSTLYGISIFLIRNQVSNPTQSLIPLFQVLALPERLEDLSHSSYRRTSFIDIIRSSTEAFGYKEDAKETDSL